ncbi:hypothetical protein MN086_04040 [Sulfurovum sp. XGS-02]|uniref:hypothetical protein n=1 Tax=Sulfurovum sp. XGS-02 TaxID=2925411 RepID=UPI00204EE898|nr:hypothetical protein [Sulfurovum sp. XGS-02]UPT78319.1 hypothetical protein MN086_04040 [Sulfurovum sp. XGS-02]
MIESKNQKKGTNEKDKVLEKELRKIFVYLASTGEVDTTKSFVSNGICSKYQGLCTLAMVAARHEKLDPV